MKLSISIVVLALFGIVATQVAVAQSSNSSPAQEALKGVRPFIGSWVAESDAYGGFEGNEESGKIDLVLRFRWLQEEAAVEFTSRIIHKKTGKQFNTGSKILSLDAETGKLQVFGYGYEGDVYFSNNGTMEIQGSKIIWKMNEVSINKTKSKYTATLTLETPKLLSVQTSDVIVDGKGVVYVADRNNNRIRKIDRLGVITTFMGTGQKEFNGDNEIPAETTLHLPFALALYGADRLLVADRNHFRLRQVGLEGQTVETVAGNGKSFFRGDSGPGPGATLDVPSGIVVDSQNNVLFADRLHHRIRQVSPDGIIHTVFGNGKQGNEGNGGLARNATLHLPETIAIDHMDNVYVTSRSGNGWIVRRVDREGVITHFAGNGRQGNTGDGGPAVEASFHTISDITTDRKGNVYITDIINRNIRKIDTEGTVTTVAGANLVSLGEEVHPNGIAIDSAGNIFFSDSGSSKVRRIGVGGDIAVVAGSGDFADHGDGGSALEAGVRSPGGLAIGPDGALYIVEQTSHRIRKVDTGGTISRKAGNGMPGYGGDGGMAVEAGIKGPFRMVFDQQKNIYFSDRDNNRIRKIDTNGIIHTVAGHSNIGWVQDGLEVHITVHNFP